MDVEEFYEKSGGVKYDKFDKKVNKFTYYDLLDFAENYHKNQIKK